MSKPLIHAKSSARRFGGIWQDYIHIHELMDSSKSVTAMPTHRALTHNTWFISTILTRIFGETFHRESDNVAISTRDIGEQHVAEDYQGFIPSASDFLDAMNIDDWMMNGKGMPPSCATLITRTNKQKQKVDKPEQVLID